MPNDAKFQVLLLVRVGVGGWSEIEIQANSAQLKLELGLSWAINLISPELPLIICELQLLICELQLLICLKVKIKLTQPSWSWGLG